MKKNKSAMIIALAAIALAAVLPMFITNNYHLNLMIQVLINIIIVVGLNFITGLTGQMNLGTAGIFSMGAYTSSLLATKLGLNPWICLVAAVGMGCLIGMGLGYPSLRVSGVYLALTPIGRHRHSHLLHLRLQVPEQQGDLVPVPGHCGTAHIQCVPDCQFQVGAFLPCCQG